jgi:hypothetical protein
MSLVERLDRCCTATMFPELCHWMNHTAWFWLGLVMGVMAIYLWSELR